MIKTHAIIFVRPGQVEIQEIEVPEPESGEVLVEIAYSCVSPGTEARVLSGSQSGAPDFPLIPGYSCAGYIVSTGSNTRLQVGTPVFCSGTQKANQVRCWGGHVGHAVVAEAGVVPIPQGVNLCDAASAKLAAIAHHGVRMASPLPNEKVAVLGLGPIGFFSALIFQAYGADVAVGDLAPGRVAAAHRAGLRIGDFSGDGGAQIIVDATGAGSALASAARLVRDLPWDNESHPPARLLIQGSYATPPPFPYDEAFARELHVLVPRDNQRSDLEATLELMATGQLKCNEVVGNFGSPTNAPDVYSQLGNLNPVTGVFDWTKI